IQLSAAYHAGELDRDIQLPARLQPTPQTPGAPVPMKRIDEARLESDLQYRVDYLAVFMGSSADDVAAIHGAASVLAPVVPTLVDAVYDKLFGYDATKRPFVPRQSGYDGELPEDLESRGRDHEMIEFRKTHLARYLVTLVTKP